MKNSKKACAFVALGVAVLLAGCTSVQRSVPLAVKTPDCFGDIRLYGTACVPFEFEEIAALAYSFHAREYTLEQGLQQFALQAKGVGADAVLNFKVEHHEITRFIPSYISPSSGWVYLTGIAVKKKRP